MFKCSNCSHRAVVCVKVVSLTNGKQSLMEDNSESVFVISYFITKTAMIIKSLSLILFVLWTSHFFRFFFLCLARSLLLVTA